MTRPTRKFLARLKPFSPTIRGILPKPHGHLNDEGPNDRDEISNRSATEGN